MEELGHFQLLGIVYRSLRHGAVHYHMKLDVMAGDKWHDNGPQDLAILHILTIKLVTFYCPQHKVHLCNDHAV